MARRRLESRFDKPTKKIVQIYTIGDLDGHDLVVLDEALTLLIAKNNGELDKWKEAALYTLNDIIQDMIGEMGNG